MSCNLNEKWSRVLYLYLLYGRWRHCGLKCSEAFWTSSDTISCIVFSPPVMVGVLDLWCLHPHVLIKLPNAFRSGDDISPLLCWHHSGVMKCWNEGHWWLLFHPFQHYNTLTVVSNKFPFL
jgi:hypothetical protein